MTRRSRALRRARPGHSVARRTVRDSRPARKRNGSTPWGKAHPPPSDSSRRRATVSGPAVVLSSGRAVSSKRRASRAGSAPWSSNPGEWANKAQAPLEEQVASRDLLQHHVRSGTADRRPRQPGGPGGGTYGEMDSPVYNAGGIALFRSPLYPQSAGEIIALDCPWAADCARSPDSPRRTATTRSRASGPRRSTTARGLRRSARPLRTRLPPARVFHILPARSFFRRSLPIPNAEAVPRWRSVALACWVVD